MMQFCPKCKKMTMMYVHGLKTAYCINRKCLVSMKFETYDDSKDVLSEKEKEYRKHTGSTLIPQVTPVSSLSPLSDFNPTILELLAKEVHEEFSRASIVHGIIDEEDYTPYDDLPHNIKEALMDVAVYLNNRYIRR